jgi:hypothetical protein
MTLPSFAERGDVLRLDGSVPGATLGVEESEQLFEGLSVRAVADERFFAFGRNKLIVFEFL